MYGSQKEMANVPVERRPVRPKETGDSSTRRKEVYKDAYFTRGVRAARAEGEREGVTKGTTKTATIVRHEREGGWREERKARESAVWSTGGARGGGGGGHQKREDDERSLARFVAHAQHELCTVAGDE